MKNVVRGVVPDADVCLLAAPIAAATAMPACPACGASTGTAASPETEYGELMCTVCSHVWRATAAELDQACAADDAWSACEDIATAAIGAQ